jgi:hypothetical protein
MFEVIRIIHRNMSQASTSKFPEQAIASAKFTHKKVYKSGRR